MFQSSDFFKHIECPFFKHDLCHRPYCHFKHIKSKKEKEKGKEDVTEINYGGAAESSAVESKPPSHNSTEERSPSPPVDDVNDEILKIISKYKSNLPQDSSSPLDDVNDEILKIVMKYKSNKETPQPADEVNDEILNIVLKYKTNRPTSSSPAADTVTDDILKIVKNISPSKLIEFAKRKEDVKELQKALDQVDEETKKSLHNATQHNGPVSSHDGTRDTNEQSTRAEEDYKRGLIDSFYSKEKVQVNITSGDLATKTAESAASSKKKKTSGKKTICNCDDPECSGFREELDGNQFQHTNVNLNEIDDEYMRRKMQRRLQRKKKILTQSETFTSVLPGTDEPFASVVPGINDPFFSDPPGIDEAFAPVIPGSDETIPLSVPDDADDIYPLDEPDEHVIDVDIHEADFFIPSPEEPAVVKEDEPEEPMDDDLSKYIDKCKEEYAKKRMEKKSTKKSILLPLDPDAVAMESEKDGGVGKEVSYENDIEEEGEENVDKNKKECGTNEIVGEKSEDVDGEVKKKRTNKENNKENSSGGSTVHAKKKRRIILPVEEESTTSSIKTDKSGKTKETTKKNKVTFADEVFEKSAEKEKVEKVEKSRSKEKVDNLKKVDGDKYKKEKPEKNKSKDSSVKDDKDKSAENIPLKRINTENESGNSDKKTKTKNEESTPVKVSSLKKPKGEISKKSEHVKTSKSAANEVGEKSEKENNMDRKDKSCSATKSSKVESSATKSSKVESGKHGPSVSDNTAKANTSQKQRKIKTEDPASFDTRERHSNDRLHRITKITNDTLKSKPEKKIKTNESKKCNDSDDNLIESGKIVENRSKEKKINTEKEISIEMKKKRTHTDSESSNSSRNAFDVIAISSSDDEQTDGAATNAQVYDEDFSDNDHGAYSEDDTYEDRETHTSRNEDNTVDAVQAKKRISLTSEEIRRKPVQVHKSKSLKMSYVSPCLKATAHALVDNRTPTPSTTPTAPSAKQSTKTSPPEVFYNSGKKRVSHVKLVPPTAAKVELDMRPKLEMDIGGKIPHLLRTKYFNKIIDELIPKCATKKEAYGKALADEGDAYKRSTRKPLYMNLCANIVKRVRAMPTYVAPKQQPEPAADPMTTAQPTTKSIRSDATNTHTNRHTTQTSTKSKVSVPVNNNVPESRIKSSNITGYKKVETKATISKKSIKPASSLLVNATADKPPVNPLKRERTASLSHEPLELTEHNFYDHMNEYLLSHEQLWQHKYPKRDEDNGEATVIKDYVANSNTLKRLCCRCGKEYFMNKKGKYVTRNECHYHWGKLLRVRGKNSGNAMQYSCCGSDSMTATCAMCRLHVSNKVGPLANYVSTEACSNKDSRRKVFALDCEMCYTTQGLELTRLTVVDFDMEQIIDLFVKPSNPIVDYNTRFSGVTRDDLNEVTTTITDIHDILLNMLDKDTILLGHSLESDLNALNIIHEKVVDTSIVFPHRMGLPLKRALRNLMVEFVQKVIQSGEGGHDSCEDARACMELMKYKFKEDQKRKRLKVTSSIR